MADTSREVALSDGFISDRLLDTTSREPYFLPQQVSDSVKINYFTQTA